MPETSVKSNRNNGPRLYVTAACCWPTEENLDLVS
jgi:hypothetical protein